MMSYLLISVLLLLSSFAFAEEMICDDFECLSEHSIEQYRQDYNQWWRIYHKAADLAKKCQSEDDVKTFLLLWSGQVDGEMAGAFYEDTDIILDEHASCFMSALNQSSKSVRDNFFNKWCPFVRLNVGSKIQNHLAKNPNDILAKKLLEHVNGKGCKS